jgi:AAA+ superfamily predicted ATPase
MANQAMAAETKTSEALAVRAMSPGTHVALSLLPALARLDRRLERALAMAPGILGQDFGQESQRGLCIEPEEIEQLFSRTPGAPLFGMGKTGDAARALGEIEAAEFTPEEKRLRDSFDLTDFDLDALLVALAPELDLRYERIYAYLQDDVTRRRPTVDLTLNLLCNSAPEKLARRSRFLADSSLIKSGLIEIQGGPEGTGLPLLARTIQIDERIVRAFTGEGGLDARLKEFCEVAPPAATREALPLPLEVQRSVLALASQAWHMTSPLRFYFHGQKNTGKRAAANALASSLGVPLLIADLALLAETGRADASTVARVFREAVLLDALLYITGLNAPNAATSGIVSQALLRQLETHPRPVILSGTSPWIPLARPELAVIPVPFQIPEFASRRSCWEKQLAGHGLTLEEEDFNDLASRFRLTGGQIAEAVQNAIHRAQWRAAGEVSPGTDASGEGEPTVEDLYEAARTQCGHELARLARKILPRYTWKDIVLPSDEFAQLQEICQQAHYRQLVFGTWGFGQKLSLGKGLNALFAGPPGTGKTMAAEVLATELKLDLYKIDLSQVINKYIGETEKNLDRIFAAAENSNAILFFDEADALFGKRSEIRDSHDRYANVEISYLLQRMEEYEGISILATNQKQNLDDAFIRRLQAIVEFPFPDEEYRRKIWQVTFPSQAPLGEDVDFAALAREIPLAGGCVKNMALAACFLAAADGGKISMRHILDAAAREFQKLGRTWTPSSAVQRLQNRK